MAANYRFNQRWVTKCRDPSLSGAQHMNELLINNEIEEQYENNRIVQLAHKYMDHFFFC